MRVRQVKDKTCNLCLLATWNGLGGLEWLGIVAGDRGSCLHCEPHSQ